MVLPSLKTWGCMLAALILISDGSCFITFHIPHWCAAWHHAHVVVPHCLSRMHDTKQRVILGELFMSTSVAWKSGIIVSENNGVWLGWDFTFDFIPQTLMSYGSCPHPPTTANWAEKWTNWDGVENEYRLGSQSTMNSTAPKPQRIRTVESRPRKGNGLVAADRQSLSLLSCLAVCVCQAGSSYDRCRGQQDWRCCTQILDKMYDHRI